MKLLFLDTETTGLDLQKEQIIELGAVIYDLDISNYKLTKVDHFQSLIKLRKELDDRIVRITGITQGDLSGASDVIKVQTDWSNWLTSVIGEEEIIVVGHSIDFDIGFLKKEGWYLPMSNKIDTLDLARILLPNYSAINLEYLSNSLGLEEKVQFVAGDNFSHHRSLYDSVMCAKLFEILLSKVDEFCLDQVFASNIKEFFLKIELTFYTKSDILNQLQITSIIDNSNVSYLNIDGTPKERTIDDYIKQLDNSTLPKLQNLLSKDLNSTIKLVLLQLYVINILKLKGASNLKFHSQNEGNIAFLLLEFLCQNTVSHDNLAVSKLETLIENLSYIVDSRINVGSVIKQLELYSQLLGSHDESLSRIISAYDFLIFSLSTIIQNGEIGLDLYKLSYQQEAVFVKIKSLLESISNYTFGNHSDPEIDIILALLEQKIKSKTSNFVINKYLTIYQSFKNLTLVTPKPHIVIHKELSKLIQNTNSQSINLSKDKSDQLLQLLGGSKVDTTNFVYSKYDYEFEVENDLDLGEFVEENITLAKELSKPIIILSGLNSSQKNLEKTATQNNLLHQCLITGENGGITKILSKVERGFVGLVFVKFSNLDFIIKNSSKLNLGKVIIYDRPYFKINSLWYSIAKKTSDSDKYLLSLKNIFLQGKVNVLHQNLGCPIEFVYNLK
jgi:DNA polymerase III epsilon subunit-like protein